MVKATVAGANAVHHTCLKRARASKQKINTFWRNNNNATHSCGGHNTYSPAVTSATVSPQHCTFSLPLTSKTTLCSAEMCRQDKMKMSCVFCAFVTAEVALRPRPSSPTPKAFHPVLARQTTNKTRQSTKKTNSARHGAPNWAGNILRSVPGTASDPWPVKNAPSCDAARKHPKSTF